MLKYVFVQLPDLDQGAFLGGGDVILPQSATVKYKKYPKILNWTVLDGY